MSKAVHSHSRCSGFHWRSDAVCQLSSFCSVPSDYCGGDGRGSMSLTAYPRRHMRCWTLFQQIVVHYWSIYGREYHTAWSRRPNKYLQYGQPLSFWSEPPELTMNACRLIRRRTYCLFSSLGVARVCPLRYVREAVRWEHLEQSLISQMAWISATVHTLFDKNVDVIWQMGPIK